MRSIDSPFDSKLTIVAAVGTVVLTVLGVVYWQRAAIPDAATPPRAANWDGPIGAGTLSAAPQELAPLGAALDVPRELSLTVDAGGHLVPDRALRRLMDSFLANGPVAGRQQRALDLRAYLKGKLAPGAANEADRIVAAYLDYLSAQDQMLARAGLSAPAAGGLTERDVERLLAVQDQRAQLRQHLLGDAITQAWFNADDARCNVVLRDWQKQFATAGASQEEDPMELRERRLHGPALAAMRTADAESCATQMRQGFAGREN